jgi:hypothetical protein
MNGQIWKRLTAVCSRKLTMLSVVCIALILSGMRPARACDPCNDPGVSCCDGEPYDPLTEICCQGTAVPLGECPHCHREILDVFPDRTNDCVVPDCTGLWMIMLELGDCTGFCDDNNLCLADHTASVFSGYAFPCVKPTDPEATVCDVDMTHRTELTQSGDCYCGT